jgi:hypothetical protein
LRLPPQQGLIEGQEFAIVKDDAPADQDGVNGSAVRGKHTIRINGERNASNPSPSYGQRPRRLCRAPIAPELMWPSSTSRNSRVSALHRERPVVSQIGQGMGAAFNTARDECL